MLGLKHSHFFQTQLLLTIIFVPKDVIKILVRKILVLKFGSKTFWLWVPKFVQPWIGAKLLGRFAKLSQQQASWRLPLHAHF